MHEEEKHHLAEEHVQSVDEVVDTAELTAPLVEAARDPPRLQVDVHISDEDIECHEGHRSQAFEQ